MSVAISMDDGGSTRSVGRTLTELSMAGDAELTVDMYGSTLSRGMNSRDALPSNASTSSAKQPSNGIIHSARMAPRKTGFLPSGMSPVTRRGKTQQTNAAGKSARRAAKGNNNKQQQQPQQQRSSGNSSGVNGDVKARLNPAVIIEQNGQLNGLITAGIDTSVTSAGRHDASNAGARQQASMDGRGGPADRTGSELKKADENRGPAATSHVSNSAHANGLSNGVDSSRLTVPDQIDVILGAPAGFRDSSFESSSDGRDDTTSTRLNGGTKGTGNAGKTETDMLLSTAKKQPAPPPPGKTLPSATGGNSTQFNQSVAVSPQLLLFPSTLLPVPYQAANTGEDSRLKTFAPLVDQKGRSQPSPAVPQSVPERSSSLSPFIPKITAATAGGGGSNSTQATDSTAASVPVAEHPAIGRLKAESVVISGGKQPVVGKLPIPTVFHTTTGTDVRQPVRSSLGPARPIRPVEIDASNSIVRRKDFRDHLEAVISRRGTPTSSAVSSMSRAPGNGNDVSASTARGLDAEQRLVSQLFRTALQNHDVGGDITDGSLHDAAGKKFRFPVAGIDVPETKGGGDGVEYSIAKQPEVDEARRVRRGFSYLQDIEQAAEVSRRAADVTSRRSHEKVTKELDGDQTSSTAAVTSSHEDDVLVAARQRLHSSGATHAQNPHLVGGHDGSRNDMLREIVDSVRKRQMKANGGRLLDDNEEKLSAGRNLETFDVSNERQRNSVDRQLAAEQQQQQQQQLARSRQLQMTDQVNFEPSRHQTHNHRNSANHTASSLREVNQQKQLQQDSGLPHAGHILLQTGVTTPSRHRQQSADSPLRYAAGYSSSDRSSRSSFDAANAMMFPAARDAIDRTEYVAYNAYSTNYEQFNRQSNLASQGRSAATASYLSTTASAARQPTGIQVDRSGLYHLPTSGSNDVGHAHQLQQRHLPAGLWNGVDAATMYNDGRHIRVINPLSVTVTPAGSTTDTPPSSTTSASGADVPLVHDHRFVANRRRRQHQQQPIRHRHAVAVDQNGDRRLDDVTDNRYRPVTVEITSSTTDNNHGYLEDRSRIQPAAGRPNNYTPVRPSPLINSSSAAAVNHGQPDRVIGIIRNPSIHRTASFPTLVSNSNPGSAFLRHSDSTWRSGNNVEADQVDYFSDPETHFGPYRTTTAAGPEMNNRRLSLPFGLYPTEATAIGIRPFPFQFPDTIAVGVAAAARRVTSPPRLLLPQPQAETVLASPPQPHNAIDPQLQDVGKLNRSVYFVEMKLNAMTSANGRVAGPVTSNSSSGSGPPTALRQGDDVMISRYSSTNAFASTTTAIQPPTYSDVTTALQQQQTAEVGPFTTRRSHVIDNVIESPNARRRMFQQNNQRRAGTGVTAVGRGGGAGGGLFARSAAGSSSELSPQASAIVTVDGGRSSDGGGGRSSRPSSGTQRDRKTVEFDVELQHSTTSVNAPQTLLRQAFQPVSISVLPSRSTDLLEDDLVDDAAVRSEPRYALQLNDTMRFNIEGAGGVDSDERRNQPVLLQSVPLVRDHILRRSKQSCSSGHRHVHADRPREKQRLYVVEADPDLDSRHIYRKPDKRSRRTRPVTTESIPIQTNRSAMSRNYRDDDDDDTDAEDLSRYLVDDQPPTSTPLKSNSDLPQVVRGSILIRNSMDTTGGPRHVDVVTVDSDSSERFVVEDNTNMFDGLYRQSRENPIYLSDVEQSDDEVDGQHTVTTTRLERRENPDSQRHTKSYRSQLRRRRRNDFDEDFDRKIDINRSFGVRPTTYSSNEKQTDHTTRRTNGYDTVDNNELRTSTTTTRHRSTTGRRGRHEPLEGVHQTIDVKREEEELMGPLPADNDDPPGTGSGSQMTANMVNVDVVSENVDVSVEDGVARLTVRVRCERIVPIRGTADMFKKSSVIVTRVIEVDLTINDERRRLYDRVVQQSARRNEETSGGGGGNGNRLGTKDTFALYRTLMGMIESDQSATYEQLHIDRILDEQRSRLGLVTSPTDLIDGQQEAAYQGVPVKTAAAAAAAAGDASARSHFSNTKSDERRHHLSNVLY